jgi:general secretion pathway protein D
VPTPVVLLEVKVLSIDLSDGFRSVFDYQFTDGALMAGGFTLMGYQLTGFFLGAR